MGWCEKCCQVLLRIFDTFKQKQPLSRVQSTILSLTPVVVCRSQTLPIANGFDDGQVAVISSATPGGQDLLLNSLPSPAAVLGLYTLQNCACSKDVTFRAIWPFARATVSHVADAVVYGCAC